jgi:hypothetical protein
VTTDLIPALDAWGIEGVNPVVYAFGSSWAGGEGLADHVRELRTAD